MQTIPLIEVSTFQQSRDFSDNEWEDLFFDGFLFYIIWDVEHVSKFRLKSSVQNSILALVLFSKFVEIFVKLTFTQCT